MLCGLSFFWSQTHYEIRGKVVDLHNNAPLQDASVKIGKLQTKTDAKGQFILQKIQKGNHIIVVSHSECEDYLQKITVDKALHLTIALEHHEKIIEDIKVSGAVRPSKSQQSHTLQGNTLSQNFQDNIGNLLAQITGVSTIKTGNNIVKPIVRGLYGSRISILTDGVKLSEQEWGVEHAPSVEASMFQKVSVVKGAGALKYSSDAMGGVVILEAKPLPAKDTLMGHFQMAGFTNGRGIKTGIQMQKSYENRWFVNAGGSFSKRGDIAIPNHTLQNTASEEHAFHFSAGKRAFDKGIEISYKILQQDFGIFTGSHLSSASLLYDVIAAGGAMHYYDNFTYTLQNPKQEVLHHTAKIEAYHRFKTIGKFKFMYAYQLNDRKEFDIRRGELKNIPSLDLQLQTHQAKLSHLLEREKWSLETAILGEYQNNYADPNTQTRRLIPDYEKGQISTYAVWEYTISPKWFLEWAARYDYSTIDAFKYYDQSVWNARFAKHYAHFEVKQSGSRILTHPVFHFHNHSVNAGFRFTPNNVWNIKANIAQVRRMPNPAELFADGLHHSAAIIERGDLKLQSEVMTQMNMAIGAKVNALKGIHLQFSPYYYHAENYIQQIPTGIQNSNRGAFVIWDYQQVKANILGFEAEIQAKITEKMTIDAQYSWLRGHNLTHTEPIILMMPPRLKTTLSYSLWKKKKMLLGIEHLFVQKQHRFPIRNVNFETIENGLIVPKTLDVSTPPAAYHLIGIHLSAEMNRHFSAHLRISNALNTEYRDYLNRLRFFAPEMGRNISLTLKYNF